MSRFDKILFGGFVIGIGGIGFWSYLTYPHFWGSHWSFREWVKKSSVSLSYFDERRRINSFNGITSYSYMGDDNNRYVIDQPDNNCLDELHDGGVLENNVIVEKFPSCKNKNTLDYLTSEYKKYNPGGPVPKSLNTTSTTIVKRPQVQKNTTVKSEEQTLSEKSINTTETQNNTSVTSQRSTISNNTVNTPFISTSSGKSDLSSQYSSLGDVVKMCKENTSVNRTIWKQDEYKLGYHSYVYGVGGIIVLTNKVYLVPYEEKTVNGSFQTWKDPSTKLIKGMYPDCDNVSEIGVFGEQFTTINDNWLFYTRCESYCERLFKLEDQNGSKVINFYHKSINGGTVQKITFK